MINSVIKTLVGIGPKYIKNRWQFWLFLVLIIIGSLVEPFAKKILITKASDDFTECVNNININQDSSDEKAGTANITINLTTYKSCQ